MATEPYIVAGIGELLWDVLPEGKQLGGAPANFAYITQLLGDRGTVASSVGTDALGDEAIARLSELGLGTEYIQRDSEHSTGLVQVQVDDEGQPTYQITESVAWDFLEWTAQWRDLARSADAVCFGSLAQRSGRSRETMRRFLAATREQAVRIFDVNLRQHFYSAEVLAESLHLADIAKLNHEEMARIMGLLGLRSGGEVESAKRLRAALGLKLVCVTRGSGGSLLVDETRIAEHPGYPVSVADTIGAGDAFTAGLVHQYLRGGSLEQMNETANRVGAWVAGQAGAMPIPDAGKIEEILAVAV